MTPITEEQASLTDPIRPPSRSLDALWNDQLRAVIDAGYRRHQLKLAVYKALAALGLTILICGTALEVAKAIWG